MTWIKATDPTKGDPALREAAKAYMALYPRDYADSPSTYVPPEGRIGASHSLLPQVMFHAFATFGAAMDPSLPLTRRDHEMIATVVSVTNRCRY
jgi:alkylhydroperoxidase family enzyme